MRQHLGNNDHGVQESSKGFVHLAREGEGWSLMAEDDQSYCQQQSHPSLDMRNTNHSKIFSYIEVRHYVTLYLLCSNSRLLWEWPIWYAHTNINRGPSLPPFPLRPFAIKTVNFQSHYKLEPWTGHLFPGQFWLFRGWYWRVFWTGQKKLRKLKNKNLVRCEEFVLFTQLPLVKAL